MYVQYVDISKNTCLLSFRLEFERNFELLAGGYLAKGAFQFAATSAGMSARELTSLFGHCSQLESVRGETALP